jgi:hypothetical protein
MQRITSRLTPAILLLAAVGLGGAQSIRPPRWQADVQIRTLEITKSRSGLSARVVVYTENDDEALDARLLILLPIGVGVERLDAGCAASAGPSMVPSLRATVSCELGPIADRGYREVRITTTLPPDDFSTRFGVFAWSGTPDPVPGNNYAERSVP